VSANPRPDEPIVTVEAPAKINLYLHVTARRSDGYHVLDSLVVFAGVGDTMVAEPADEITLDSEGPFAAWLGAAPDNLALKAARLLAARAGVRTGARLTLVKRLPIASGIGRRTPGPLSRRGARRMRSRPGAQCPPATARRRSGSGRGGLDAG